MKASEYLRQLYMMNVVIRQKREELVAVREAAASVGTSYRTEEKGSGGGAVGEARFAKLCDKAMDIEKEIEKELGNYIEKQHLIINQIQGLEDSRHVEVLYLKFVKCKSLAEISEEMNYSYKQIKRIYRTALCSFEEKILKNDPR